MADAKKRPGAISMGSSGTGTISHLYMEKVKRAAGIDITHIPYRGGGPAIQDLVSGTIDIMFDVIPALPLTAPPDLLAEEAVAAKMGLALLAGLVDDLEVSALADGVGTEVRMSWPLEKERATES